MQFKELLSEVKDLLNFNSAQTNQDFTEDQIKSAINRAYLREYRKAKQNGSHQYFLATTTFTWSASDTEVDLTDPYDKAQIVQFMDVTGGEPGYNLIFNDLLRWKDRNTLEWLTTGPASDRTIRVLYYDLPKRMTADLDEPVLVKAEFRELLVYSAAIELRMRADEEAPPSWERHLMSCRMDWYKDLSLGNPLRNYPTIHNPDSEQDALLDY